MVSSLSRSGGPLATAEEEPYLEPTQSHGGRESTVEGIVKQVGFKPGVKE